MRPFLARYRLRNGAHGVLHVIAACSCDAIVIALETFGEQVRSCSARPA